ncbi:MAG: SRPBCC family protein [Burkholderiales bacterium]
MVKIALLAVAAGVAAILLIAATRPDTFTVQRSATIPAPAQTVHALIEDFERWDAWSPWEKKDPAMKRTFGAITRGKGATYAWEGNGEVGQGRMEIVDSVSPSKVAIQLDFVEPFEAHNSVLFALVPSGQGTDVTWTMQGGVPYLARIVHMFLDMDRMVGKDFETGLANLKLAAERQAAGAATVETKR